MLCSSPGPKIRQPSADYFNPLKSIRKKTRCATFSSAIRALHSSTEALKANEILTITLLT